VTYVLPAVKGERPWAYPIFNCAADLWLDDGGGGGGGGGSSSASVLLDLRKVRKTPFWSRLYANAIILPRQARDKHRES
jgi:hypothetical protein